MVDGRVAATAGGSAYKSVGKLVHEMVSLSVFEKAARMVKPKGIYLEAMMVAMTELLMVASWAVLLAE